MKWIGRILGSVLSVVSGFVAIAVVVESHFGGSFPGFLGLLAILVAVGALLGYAFTRLGEGSMRRSVLIASLYAAPVALLTFGIGGPPVVMPVIPLLFASGVLGGRAAVRRRRR